MSWQRAIVNCTWCSSSQISTEERVYKEKAMQALEQELASEETSTPFEIIKASPVEEYQLRDAVKTALTTCMECTYNKPCIKQIYADLLDPPAEGV